MRVEALEAAGVIQKYVALADAAALGLGLNVFINISLKEQTWHSLSCPARNSIRGRCETDRPSCRCFSPW